MKELIIRGGTPLCGEVEIHGAKNSVLPVLCASLLGHGRSVITRCPHISDVSAACEILEALGAHTERVGESIVVLADGAKAAEIPRALMEKMRASVVFLGALLSRFGQAQLYLPGGCALGARPIDYHIAALKTLGVTLREEGDRLLFSWQHRRSGEVFLPFPSVGATENVLLAALSVQGETVVHNAAQEPEVEDLCRFLSSMGAEIHGAGTQTVTVCGGKTLRGAVCSVLPDRIETATYLALCAACGGKLILHGTEGRLLAPVLSVLRKAGCTVREDGKSLYIESAHPLKGAGLVTTAPYPGFPTDAQAPVMAALLRAEGETEFEETVFRDRYRHALELQKFGADITLDGQRATVRGTKALHAATVQATDLRGGAAAVIAALQAQGQSIVQNAHYIARGYADFIGTLRRLGADVCQRGMQGELL